MSQAIETSIKFAAMQTYGQRVRIARDRARMSQAELGNALGGLKQPSILAIEKRETKSKYTVEIARITGVSAEWLDSGEGKMIADKPLSTETIPPPVEKPLTSPSINIQHMTQDVPIVGGASCGDDGLFELNGQVLGYARRPPLLVGAKGIYALYVDGESMKPWRETGQLVYVNPNQPIKVGDYVVVEMAPEKGSTTHRAYIKRLVKRTAESLRLEQFNPAEEISLPMKRVKTLHRVVDWSELLGL